MAYDLLKLGEAAGWWKTRRPLTHSSDLTREGLAVDATRETWKPVVGYEGFYEVSDQGRVRSLNRVSIRNGRAHKMRGRVLTAVQTSKYGYRKVNLGRNNPEFVHRLVMAAFVGPGDGLDVDHRDGNPANNHLANLRYLSHADNMIAQRERKPRCQRGHEFAEDGRFDQRGRRFCMECTRVRDRARYRKEREAEGKTVSHFRVTSEFLRQVVETFNSVDRGRRAAVMSRFGVSESQVKRYLQAARAEGLL